MRKFENIDLIEGLRNIVKSTVEHHQGDLVYDIAGLKKSNIGDSFIFIARDSGTYLLKEKNICIKDTHDNTICKGVRNTMINNYKIFAIEITNKEKGNVFGNLYEQTRQDISKLLSYEKPPETVKISFYNGQEIVCNYNEYADTIYSIAEKFGEIKKIDYFVKDEIDLKEKLSDFMRSRYSFKSSNLNEYFKELNNQKIMESGYSQKDMFWVASINAYRLLTKTNISVYELQGNEKFPIDAETFKRNLRDWKKKTFYAISKADKEKFDDYERKYLAKLVEEHLDEKNRKEQVLSYGYIGCDAYMINTKEAELAFKFNIPVFKLGKGYVAVEAINTEDAKSFVREGGLIAIRDDDKDNFIKIREEISEAKSDKTKQRPSVREKITNISKMKQQDVNKEPARDTIQAEAR